MRAQRMIQSRTAEVAKIKVYFCILSIFVGQFVNWFSDFKEMTKLFTVLNPKSFEPPYDDEEKLLELIYF